MAQRKAPFIAFEGIDKSGKGVQVRLAIHELSQSWSECVKFSEPNDRDNPTGRRIRKVLEHEVRTPSIKHFQRWFVHDRAQDTICIVLPALERNVPVVADRFALSTIAYGSLEGKAEDYIRMHQDILGPDLRWPDLTIILDITAKEAMRRLEKECGKPQLFEKAQYLSRIRQAYLQLPDLMRQWAPEMKIVVLDANKSVSEVTADVQAVLHPYLS